MEALILLPLLSALLGGAANVYGKKLAGAIRPRPFAAVSFVYIVAWMTPIALYTFAFTPTPRILALLGVVAVLDAGANYCYFKGLDLVEVSDVSAIGALAPLFTTLFATLLLPEALTGEAVVAAVAITLAVYALTVERGTPLLEAFRSSHAVYPLLSGLLFGLSAIPIKVILSTPGVNAPTLYWLRSVLVGAILLLLVRPTREDVTGSTRGIALRAGIIGASWLLYYAAIQSLNVLIAVALSYTTPLFTLLIANRELGEELTLRRIAAILVILASIVLVRL